MSGESVHTVLFDRIEFRAFCLVNSPTLTNSIKSLSSSRTVTSLSLSYRYYNEQTFL